MYEVSKWTLMNIPKITYSPKSHEQTLIEPTNIHMHISVFRLEYLFVCCCRSILMYCACVRCTVYGHRPYQHCNGRGFVFRSIEYSNDSPALSFPSHSKRWIHSFNKTDDNIDIKKQTATAWIIPIESAPCIVRCCFQIVGQCPYICSMIAIKIALMLNFN